MLRSPRRLRFTQVKVRLNRLQPHRPKNVSGGLSGGWLVVLGVKSRALRRKVQQKGRRVRANPPPVRRALRLRQQVQLTSPGEGLGAVPGAQFTVDVVRVALDRARGDEEVFGDLGVGPARSQ